uniref:Papilin, proteoglycan like sulfated glycoprotein n=1 Tax=Myotis lucifugus TaxID=59463 RepID=G1Q7M1_MYOLU
MLLLLLAALLLAPAPGASAPKVRRQSDTWGPWGDWSPCSRTCGGGISFRERFCYSQRRDGGSSCVGPARRHRLCHIEMCIFCFPPILSFVSCFFVSAFFMLRCVDRVPFCAKVPRSCKLDGPTLTSGLPGSWISREAIQPKPPCRAWAGRVPRDQQGGVVGCDHKLDSSKQEDKCLQCGGDGTTCYPVTGTFDVSDLSRGARGPLMVPTSAHASLWVPKPAPHSGLCKAVSSLGTLIPRQPSPAASCLPSPEPAVELGTWSPQGITSLWPLVIDSSARSPSPGVRYEYHLPLSTPRPGFSWSHGSWSDCSAECGGGHQSRPVFCTIDNEVYPDHMCQHQPRPATRRPCSPHSCPQTQRWKTGPWTPCSASCGGGSQSRSVYCVWSDGAGGEEAMEEVQCAGLPGKPATTQACNLQRCAAWREEPWGECSVSCGAGIRRRSVTCQGDEGSLLHASACSFKDPPPLTEPCVHDDCPRLSDQAWHVGAWESTLSPGCEGGDGRSQAAGCSGLRLFGRAMAHAAPLLHPLHPTPAAGSPEAPSGQDVHTSFRAPWMSLGPREAPALGSRDQWWATPEQPSTLGNPREDGPHLPAPRPASSLQPSPEQQPLWSGSEPQDCRHSPHGCCPDGHTASLGPQWQGCPGASCQQSRYGCCPDGVSVAEGPHQAGCAKSNGDDRRRSGSRAVASTVPQAHQPQAQQSEPTECRGSQFGCCYDNVASAAGPFGEGCVGQPSYVRAWPARSPFWCRRPWGGRCGSSARVSPPWTPLPGGRRTGSPSLTGVCGILPRAAPRIP